MKNVRHQLTRVRLGLGLLALAFVQVAHAGFEHAQASSGWRVDWNSGHMQPSAQWVPSTGTTAVGNAGFSTATGTPVFSSTAKFPFPNGNTIDVTARAVPNGASMGTALANFAKKTFLPLSLGLAIYDLAKELGFDLSKDAQGNLVVQKQDPTVCTVSPCYEYSGAGNQWSSSRQTAAELGSAWETENDPTYKYILVPGSVTTSPGYGSYYVDVRVKSSNGLVGTYQRLFNIRTVSPSSPSYIPATQQEFIDAVANKSGWPSTSALAPAVKQAIESGETVTTATPTVTGPATAPGPSTTTTSNGNTTVKQDTYNITYNSNVVSYTTTTTTSVNGVQTESTTKTDDPVSDQCAKYPDSVGCAKLDTPNPDKLTNVSKAFTVASVAFASSSTCPAPLSFTVAAHSYSVSYQPLCDRLYILRTLFLMIAAFIAAWIVADSFKVAS